MDMFFCRYQWCLLLKHYFFNMKIDNKERDAAILKYSGAILIVTCHRRMASSSLSFPPSFLGKSTKAAKLTNGPGEPGLPGSPRWPLSPFVPRSPVSPLSPRPPAGPFKKKSEWGSALKMLLRWKRTSWSRQWDLILKWGLTGAPRAPAGPAGPLGPAGPYMGTKINGN